MRGLIGPPCQTIITSSFPGRSIGWIVRVSFAFDLDVSFNGSALGVVQPDFSRPSFVIAGFTEEGPVTYAGDASEAYAVTRQC